MLTVQHLFRPEGIVSDAKGQVPLQTSAEFVRTGGRTDVAFWHFSDMCARDERFPSTGA
jgi:hypothetical protein